MKDEDAWSEWSKGKKQSSVEASLKLAGLAVGRKAKSSQGHAARSAKVSVKASLYVHHHLH